MKDLNDRLETINEVSLQRCTSQTLTVDSAVLYTFLSIYNLCCVCYDITTLIWNFLVGVEMLRCLLGKTSFQSALYLTSVHFLL